MSIANLDFEENRNATERTVTLTNKATYTVKVGTSANDLKADKVINVVTTADGNDLVITVPGGQHGGQRLLINLVTLGDNETVTVTTTTGDDAVLDEAGDYVALEWTNATSCWQLSHYEKQ